MIILSCRKSKEEISSVDNTMIVDFNLSMEWALRNDRITIIQKNKEALISGIIKQKIVGIDDDFSKTILTQKKFDVENKKLNIEHFLKKNENRVMTENSNVLMKIYKENDTTIFYSYGLSDKARFIKEYFELMKNIYPKQEAFIYPTNELKN